jgi:hypothetical protein
MSGLSLTRSISLITALGEHFLNLLVGVARSSDQAFSVPHALEQLFLNIESQHPLIERISAKLVYLSEKSEKPVLVSPQH